MGKIIAVAQHKGGTGKTTTCVNVGASLCDMGKSVLVVDLDPQASLTVSMGINPLQVEKSIHGVLVDPDMDIRDAIVRRPTLNFFVVPSNLDLIMAESELAGKIGREKALRKKLAPLKADFDYIFIDCPPTLGILVINALAAADSVLIPIQCEPLTFYGVKHLLQVINLVKEEVNPELKIEGVLRTMYDRRTKLSEEVSNSIKETFGDLVFSTIIYRHIKFAEGPVHEMPINFYASKSAGAVEYCGIWQRSFLPMKPKKLDRSVSSMEVLKDIRGLLSTTQKQEDSAEARSRDERNTESKTVQLEEEVRRYKELVQKQQEELHRLESEKKELTGRLSMLSADKNKPSPPAPGAEKLTEEIAQLEAKRDELTSAVSEIESLLQLKVKDLMNRIARMYQEAGQDEIVFDLRRVRDELEVYDNFAYFLRALLR